MDDEIKEVDLLRQPAKLLELERRDPRRAEAIWHGLSREQRLRAILAAPPLERERLITLARDSAELVRALAPDEFAATALALGPADAGTLLALCSDEQLTYLLDLTGWVKERFAPSRYEVWLPLLLEAGSRRLGRWLFSTDREVLALLFAHWLRVVKWVASQDEQEPPDDLPSFTLDGVYYIAFRDEKGAGFVAQVLVLLQSERPELYRRVMEAMLWEPASLLAEDALRWRTGRMLDHGFPDRLDALQLWARPAPGEADWENLPPKAELGFPAQTPPRSDAAVSALPSRELLPTLAGELDGLAADALRAELAYVANCGVVALDADPADPEDVERAARESLGLVNLGLELLSGGDQARARAVLARMPLAALARQGAQAIRELNQAAWRLVREDWLKDIPTGLHILDEPLDRWLAGLIFPRPRCYDPTLGPMREYRAFLSRADLEAARRHLERARFWGRLLFELLGIPREDVVSILREPVWPRDPTDIKLTHLIGTWLARRALGRPGLAPIARQELGAAIAAIQEGLAGPLGRELSQSCQALPQPGEAETARVLLQGVLNRLREELGRLDPKLPIEPAFVGGLVIER